MPSGPAPSWWNCWPGNAKRVATPAASTRTTALVKVAGAWNWVSTNQMLPSEATVGDFGPVPPPMFWVLKGTAVSATGRLKLIEVGLPSALA